MGPVPPATQPSPKLASISSACWGCGASARGVCTSCHSPICPACCLRGLCPHCANGMGEDEDEGRPENPEPQIQTQAWQPMKKGTKVLLDAGRRVAEASIRQGLRGSAVRSCLVVGSLATTQDQARGSKGQRILHEYCCSSRSRLGSLAVKRGFRVRRWGLHNTDLFRQKKSGRTTADLAP